MAQDNSDGAGEFLATPQAPPNLNIPPSQSTVSVSVIDTGVRLSLPLTHFFEHEVGGKTRLTGPAYSFLVTNARTGQILLFDLAVRKDFRTGFAPAVQERVNDPRSNWGIDWVAEPFTTSSSPGDGGTEAQAQQRPPPPPRDVVDVLQAGGGGGVRPADVGAVVWSHHHFDHTGDVTRFPRSTALVVGRGFKAAVGAGWPAVAEAPVKGAEWEGRELVEVGFEEDGLRIGRFAAVDWWGDGSFYLLDTPGHAVGHLCGLARVRAGEEEAFVFLGGDCAHHPAEFRPSSYLPLPRQVSPSPLPHRHAFVCPGELFTPLHPAASAEEKATQPFYHPKQGFPHDFDDCIWSIAGMQEFDADERVLVVNAHDESLLRLLYGEEDEGKGVVGRKWVWPEGSLDAWREVGQLGRRGRWAFLGDFAGAVGTEGERTE